MANFGYQDNPGNILGANTADNLYDSSSVAANNDGSMIERLEALKDAVASVGAAPGNFVWGVAPAGTSSTTAVVISALAGYGDDYFNDEYYMQILKNANSAGNAPEKQVRKITDYVSATGTFTCSAFGAAVEANDICLIVHESIVALGRDDNDNNFASTNVAANADGSILERLEYLQGELGASVGASISADIAAIKAQTDEIGAAVGASISADIAAVQAAVDTNATYIDTEVAAIKTETDKIGTVANSGGTATIGAVIGDANNVNIVTRLGSITTQTDKIGTISNAGGTATIGGAIGAVANNPLVDRLADIQTEVDKIGAADGATTETLNGKLGTDTELADRSLYDIINGGGPAAAATAAAPANDVSLYAAIRAIFDRQLGDGTNASTNSRLGKKVTRTAADIFNGTPTALFTVATGKVLVTAITIEVTTAAIDAGASATKLVTNPTVGTDADMCAALDINADEAGTIYSLTGEPATALTGGSGGGAPAMIAPWVVAEGTIDLQTAADVGTGGALGYCELWYIPLDDGATVTAA
jgi:hypothetical protein